VCYNPRGTHGKHDTMVRQPTDAPNTLILTLATVALALATTAGRADADDWPQWLGPTRDGVSAETGWRASFDANGPARLWETRVGLGYSSVAVVSGRVYTLGNTHNTDTVWCLDAETGRVVWKHSYACSATAPRVLIRLYPGTRSTPTVSGSAVYTFSRDGKLFCLNAADGKQLWSVDVKARPLGLEVPSWGFACSPLVTDKWVVLDLGPIVALDKATGKLAWQSKTYAAGYGSPIALRVAGRACIATFHGPGLTVVDAADGTEVLQYPFRFLLIENCVTPLVAGDLCFVSAGDSPGGALVRLTADKAVEVWRSDAMVNLSTNSVVWKGHLYGFHGSALGAKSFRCVELVSGKRKWNTRSIREGALMVADGKLIAMDGRGELAIAEATPEAFRPLTRVKVLTGTCWTVPVLANSRIYCRNAAGDLVCLDVRPGDARK